MASGQAGQGLTGGAWPRPGQESAASLLARASPIGTALVCLRPASPRSYSDLPGCGLACGASGEQTRCGQRGAGGEARVTRPRTASHCLGSNPDSEGKRTSQGRRAVAEQGTAPAGLSRSGSLAAPAHERRREAPSVCGGEAGGRATRGSELGRGAGTWVGDTEKSRGWGAAGQGAPRGEERPRGAPRGGGHTLASFRIDSAWREGKPADPADSTRSIPVAALHQRSCPPPRLCLRLVRTGDDRAGREASLQISGTAARSSSRTCASSHPFPRPGSVLGAPERAWHEGPRLGRGALVHQGLPSTSANALSLS